MEHWYSWYGFHISKNENQYWLQKGREGIEYNINFLNFLNFLSLVKYFEIQMIFEGNIKDCIKILHHIHLSFEDFRQTLWILIINPGHKTRIASSWSCSNWTSSYSSSVFSTTIFSLDLGCLLKNIYVFGSAQFISYSVFKIEWFIVQMLGKIKFIISS